MFKVGDIVEITNIGVNFVAKIKRKHLFSKIIYISRLSGPFNSKRVRVEDTKKITQEELNACLGFETKYHFVKKS